MQDLNRLATLIAVSETGSISKAAARLGYTPPALSQHLAKLERDVGMVLLVRSSRGVELTQAGQTLLVYARQVMHILDEARSALAEVAGLTEGRIRIGSFTTAGVHLLPQAVLRFRRNYPNIHTSIHEYEPPTGDTALINGEIDVLLTHVYEHGPVSELPPSLESETVLVEALYAVMSADHEAAREPGPLPPRELARWPLVTGPRGFANREALETYFAAEGMGPPKIALETGNYAMATSLAVSGSALALVPTMSLPTGHSSEIVIRRLAEPGLSRQILLVWRSFDTPPGLGTIRQFIRDRCRDYAEEGSPVP
ncbi:LysR family transcriptional regulator [Nonomuraea rubra]|uniref:LysR family transcriptional regulator n=1 Tax=Nonomuraea rubra TaxID=46180 RepID=UPI0033C903E1